MSQIAVLTKERGIVSMNKSFDFMCINYVTVGIKSQ